MTDITPGAAAPLPDVATMTPEQVRGEIADTLHGGARRPADSAYANNQHPGHDDAVRRMGQLYARSYPEPEPAAGAEEDIASPPSPIFEAKLAAAMDEPGLATPADYMATVANQIPHDLPPEQATAIYGWLHTIQAPRALARGLVSQLAHARRNPPDKGSNDLRHQVAEAELRRQHGEQFDLKLAAAKRMIEKLPDAALFKDLMVDTQLGNNPVVVTWLADHAVRRGF
jgi:hypothetical protein